LIDQRLITFLTICKTKNFTKASELLNMTQPAVTKHIKFLEDYYKAPLFKRHGRLNELTEEGKILFEYAKNIEIQSTLIERKIMNSAEVEKHYSIGATLTIGEYVLPCILGEYKKFKRNTDITMHVFNTEIVSKMLLNGEIDMGIVEGPFDRTKFSFSKLCDDELVFVVSPQSQFASRQAVELDEILKSKLILREYGSGTRKVLEDKLSEMEISLSRLKPYMEIGSIGAIKSLVELNLGCTIISKAAIQKECASGSLVMIPINNIKIIRGFNFIFLEDSPKEFIQGFITFALGNLDNSGDT